MAVAGIDLVPAAVLSAKPTLPGRRLRAVIRPGMAVIAAHQAKASPRKWREGLGVVAGVHGWRLPAVKGRRACLASRSARSRRRNLAGLTDYARIAVNASSITPFFRYYCACTQP
jgi:hypothetical protein